MFPEGECLHATINDAGQCITCIPNKPNNIIHIKFEFLYVCPEYIISDEELYDGPNAPLIHFSVYTYQ